MILIFDYFETLVHSKSMDFNRGLKVMWEKYYKNKCSFAEISVFADTLFQHLLKVHQEGNEYAFVKDELPQYAEKYGGDIIKMSPEEEVVHIVQTLWEQIRQDLMSYGPIIMQRVIQTICRFIVFTI